MSGFAAERVLQTCHDCLFMLACNNHDILTYCLSLKLTLYITIKKYYIKCKLSKGTHKCSLYTHLMYSFLLSGKHTKY